MRAVIMAGGKGSRLHSLTKDQIPKPLVAVCGKPILQWQIECLKRSGIVEICIVTGHLGDKIHDYFGNGALFGVTITYFNEEKPLGTAGALAYIGNFIQNEDFLLLLGDTIFDIDVIRMVRFHEEKHAKATLLVHPNSHPFDSDLVILDSGDCVTTFDGKNSIRNYWYDNVVNAGIYILNPSILLKKYTQEKMDLEKDILAKQIEQGDVFGYRTTEYVKDAGTVERIKQVENDISAGIVAAKNLSRKQQCIFLDRDGTLNKYKGLIDSLDKLELEATSAKAIQRINGSHYLAICITNQPVVARGLCGIDDVFEIHRKLSTLLGNNGAYLDDIQFCPHHPDKGYPEENPKYKVLCNCRKPGIKLLMDCAERWNIDLSQSWIIGDTTTDIQTGKNAGLKTILVQTGKAGNDGKFVVSSDAVFTDVLDGVEHIMRR